MSVDPISPGSDTRQVNQPRPGHADLPGALKYLTYDARTILERASARETASRVAAGSFCRLLLEHFGVRIGSHVLAIGKMQVSEDIANSAGEDILKLDPEDSIRCMDIETANRMREIIDEARGAGDTVGGILEVVAVCVPPGLGSHIQWDRKLDGMIAQAMMSIPAAKGVAIGSALSNAHEVGSKVHDEIFYDPGRKCFFHKTNRAGGIEGGITNGEEVRVRVYMKPIPTLRKPLKSASLQSKQKSDAAFERSDTCIVPAAGVIAESMLGYILAGAFLDKFGGDSIVETEGNFSNYSRLLNDF
jgi:chorismate synthase